MLFRRDGPKPTDSLTRRELDELLRPLEQRLELQQKATEELRRISNQRELEWSEWFDKFRRLYARIAKRMRDDELEREEEKKPLEVAPGREIAPQLGYGHHPLPAQKFGRPNYGG